MRGSERRESVPDGAVATSWSVVHSSVRGSSHVRSGKANQDAVAAAPLEHGLVVAVADGHGGSAYVRSDVGAQLAVATACDLAGLHLHDDLRDTASLEAAAGLFTDHIVIEWQRRVADHLETHPWDDHELEAGPSLPAVPLTGYGSTLLIAVGLERQLLLCQLGDGDIVVVADDGRTETPIPTDDRLIANQTTSLCLDSAQRDFRVAVRPLAPRTPRLVVLATDGYGNSFADEGWEDQVGTDLIGHIERSGLSIVESHLSDWIAASADIGGDDVTVAVLESHCAEPSAAVGLAADVRSERPARRVTLAVLMCMLALAAVGLIVLSRSPSPASPPDSSVPVLGSSVPGIVASPGGAEPGVRPTAPIEQDTTGSVVEGG